MAFKILPKETLCWNDTEIIPIPQKTYTYREFALAGKHGSAKQTNSATADFAAPTNLQTEKITDKSFRLLWTDNSNGEQGFKIDRKIDEGEWAIAYGAVLENQNTYSDTNVFRATLVKYMVYGYCNNIETTKIEAIEGAFLTVPEVFKIDQNSLTSITLSWDYNGRGGDGFKIERKIDSGNWEMMADNINPDQNNLTDQRLELSEHMITDPESIHF